ncbi:MAG: M20/M25/M40 family metallo-hydrolase [Gemmatimonadales bacterium]
MRLTAILILATAGTATAQSFPTDDAVLRRVWAEGMTNSQAMSLIQVLTDSIGPRLTATPGMAAGQAWLQAMYGTWGIPARAERYGTWMGWKRGVSQVDLVAPRVRSLEGMMLAWSPGTRGKAVEGGTIVLSDTRDTAAFAAWLPQVKGKFVLASMPQFTCRPDSSYIRWSGQPLDSLEKVRSPIREQWRARLLPRTVAQRLEDAGALGIITSNWTGGWGAIRVFYALTRKVPTVGLSCEDYGLVFRLTERNQAPVLRVTAESEFQGEISVFNVIAEIRGSEKPNEYVMLSAHFDSWDGSSGATDNGTGSITMLEAMRILKTAYPQPKRTILVGHWSGEEQGLVGSRAFAEDHPEVVQGLQALLNQDNGTGRVVNLSAAGLIDAGANISRWVSRLPAELGQGLNLGFPGSPAGGGSDNASFACHGAPGFGLGSESADYGTYTWHTTRDTYDKVIEPNLKRNATLTAMLAYLASEDPVTVPRERRIPAAGGGPGGGGGAGRWPACVSPARSWAVWTSR